MIPRTIPNEINKAQSISLSQGSIHRKAAQAQSVPTVPGATGDSPAPNPNAIHREALARMK
jgi:hypothetical protein